MTLALLLRELCHSFDCVFCASFWCGFLASRLPAFLLAVFLVPLLDRVQHVRAAALSLQGVLIALADLTDFLPLLPEASRRWLLAEGDSVGSVPNSQWPQTVEDAREHLLASDAAARPREGTVGMEERLQAASGAAAETGIDVLHPFWVRRSQLASCPDVRFAVEGSAVDITTRVRHQAQSERC